MTKEEIQIAQAAYCVGKMWDEYEGTEDFDLLVGKRVQHLIELVRNHLQQEQPEFFNKIWHKVSEEANLTRPVVLSDGDKYMSPPCTFPFKDMSGFVEAMNKKYKADYTIWAYMDDLLNIHSLQQEQPSLPSGLDDAAEKYSENILANNEDLQDAIEDAFKAGAEWVAGHGWHDVTEMPSIFGFYLVIHEKGWCVANYMGKGVVCESGWVEAIHHIEIEHPQKWLDLRDLIPKKQ